MSIFGLSIMKLYICFCRSLNGCFREAFDWLQTTFQLAKQIILKSENELTDVFGMRFAPNAPCQKFWIG